MKKILVIDDERLISHMIRVVLEDKGHSVTGFSNPLEGEQEAIKNRYDFIFVDINMPEKNGAEITKTILKTRPESKIIIITAFPTETLAQEALASGAFSIVAKPLTLEKIINLLKINEMEGKNE